MQEAIKPSVLEILSWFNQAYKIERQGRIFLRDLPSCLREIHPSSQDGGRDEVRNMSGIVDVSGLVSKRDPDRAKMVDGDCDIVKTFSSVLRMGRCA